MKIINYLLTIFFAGVLLIHSGCEKTEYPAIIVEEDPITDIDGNVYKTANIGNQRWTIDNLNVSHFRNGDPIPHATTMAEWQAAGAEGKPAWCYYNNDPNNASTYGKLYNWYAVNDPRGLEPESWRVPTTKEWADLIDYLDGNDLAGRKLKSISGWDLGGNGDNSSKFNGLPGGGRLVDGEFKNMGTAGVWWTSSEHSAITCYGYNINNTDSKVLRGTFDKATGLSVRSVYCPDCTGDKTSVLTFPEKLQRALDVSLESGIGIGVSAAVIMSDGETWVGSSGVSYGSIPITNDMPFGAGSITKNFTAATILKLAEEGELSLDDSLYAWLPSYPNVDSTITIRQLLNHTSGLNDIADNPNFWVEIFQDPSRSWNPEDIIFTFNNEPVFAKGTGWNYSSTGYILLRMIVEKITGSDIGSVYQDRFFNPYDLSNTFASKGEFPVEIAHGWYDLDNDGDYDDFFQWPRTAFASGICGEVFSTAEDLAKWARALYHDKIVLSQESLDQMLSFHSPCTGEEFMCAGYGLGAVRFNPDLFNGLEAIGHSGTAPGYAAASIYLPDYKVTIGIVDNTEEGNSMYAINDFLSIIIDYLEK